MGDTLAIHPVMVDQLGSMLAEKHHVGGDARHILLQRRRSLLLATLSTAGTTSPDWRFSLRSTWCRRRIWSIQSWGVPFQSGVPCYAQCVAHNIPACMLLNRRLHSRRINSRSVCRRVIPVNRDWSHCRRKSLISAVETAGPVTLVISRSVTSWKPRGFALASGTSTFDTVLGSTGQHPNRFGIIVKCP